MYVFRIVCSGGTIATYYVYAVLLSFSFFISVDINFCMSILSLEYYTHGQCSLLLVFII